MIAQHVYLAAPGASLLEIKQFYGQALGLSEFPVPPSLAHVPVIWFSAGAIKLHIGYSTQGTVGDGHVALAVPDVLRARKRIDDLGYSTEDETIPMGYPRFYCRDPWGNQFEILPEGLP